MVQARWHPSAEDGILARDAISVKKDGILTGDAIFIRKDAIFLFYNNLLRYHHLLSLNSQEIDATSKSLDLQGVNS